VHSCSAGVHGAIHIKVNGLTLHQQNIEATKGWVRFNIPFNQQEIVVEHMPLGWNMEYLFYDYAIQASR
ncbi:MAG: hypothetical protein HC818_07015, partial [Synechococcaceae cyanobacterium RM1_1_27]|nr:hypothetical protein [Synechococcaceae cyanobacterium RM1_1_27]